MILTLGQELAEQNYIQGLGWLSPVCTYASLRPRLNKLSADLTDSEYNGLKKSISKKAMLKHNITTKLNQKQNMIVYIMQFYGNVFDDEQGLKNVKT